MVNWGNIRPINTSQRTGFEKFCCQFASYENVPKGSLFTPKGDPDAGVECYWKLPDGEEWGWQAKYFLSTPDDNQWKQIDKSVKKALDKHPSLKKYYICIPLDRADPRIKGKNHFMNKWQSHVKKWKGWAKEKDMEVEFIYWGETELLERLSREEHKGKQLFWFNEEQFSNSWFKNRVNDTITNAGPRYSPEINVELPISRYFDYLGLTKKFYEKRYELYRRIKKNRSLLRSNILETLYTTEIDNLQNKIDVILSIIQPLELLGDLIDLNTLSSSAAYCMESAEKCISLLKSTSGDTLKQIISTTSNKEDIKQTENNYRALINVIGKVKHFADNNLSKLANSGALLIDGEAGIGKTHLLCDIAEKRLEDELPTILLLGGQFNSDEPWTQIIKQLGLSCNRDEFLGALEAAAHIKGSRSLILIDALNEGSGISLWPNYLAGMLNTLSRYPLIGIAVSIRDSYLDAVVPQQALKKLIYTKHDGFSTIEYDATETFFEYYGINSPLMPLLNPEFSNQLFLKIFCESLNNRGLSEIQPGTQSISSIFDFYINSVNKKLSHHDYLDFDNLSSPVKEAISQIAEIMANKQIKWLPREEVKKVVEGVLPSSSYENSLFRHLISEGMLSEDITWNNDQSEDVIRFTYERFTDYMITEFFLNNHLDVGNLKKSFSKDKPLGLLFNENNIYFNSGFIEALFVLIPERTGIELSELIPDLWDIQFIRNAFLKSLFWRDIDSFSDNTRICINHIIKYEDSLNRFMGCILTLSLNKNHPYNAEKLHEWLSQFEMEERDELWSIFIYRQYSYERSLNRLIDWALKCDDDKNVDLDVLFLYGIVLGWFLTTSHRYVRDKSTKALVNLFTNNISILRSVIEIFIDVNDPYILERLLAAAYGCAMRSKDTEEISNLAKDTYNWIFVEGEVFPHVLLRDYARGIVEIALMHDQLREIDLDKVQPPYNSKFPTEFPDENELKKKCDCKNCTKVQIGACEWIYESVMGFGDFSRYIIGTNWGHSNWSSDRLNGETASEKFDNFIDSLTSRQNTFWEKYIESTKNLKQYNKIKRKHDLNDLLIKEISWNPEFFAKKLGIETENGSEAIETSVINRSELSEINSPPKIIKSENTEIYEFLKGELENTVIAAKNDFIKTLRGKKRKKFKNQIQHFLDDNLEIIDSFNMLIAQKWIFNKVFDLGWTAKKFGNFDRELSYDSKYYRSSKKPERIGKKYQWIAYHEFLARLSDNFEFVDDNWRNNQESGFQGPWQIHGRDIDPSCLLTKTETENWKPHTNSWYFPVKYNNWESKDDSEWVTFNEDLPDFQKLIEVTNPQDNSTWLTLVSPFTWEQPHPPEEGRYDSPRRHIDYLVNSYLVKKSDIKKLFDWVLQQDCKNLSMPHPTTFYNTFLGEFFWSSAFKYEDDSEWISIEDFKVLTSTVSYSEEDAGYDCSIEDSFSIHAPNNEIFNKMDLNWQREGFFYDKNGNLIAFNPSIDIIGPGTFLIKKEEFLKFLNDNDYELLWFCTGRKMIIGDGTPEQRLHILGIYITNGNVIEGEVKTEFEDWNAEN